MTPQKTKRGRTVCFVDVNQPSEMGGVTLCKQLTEDVRWTMGYRVSVNPPYKKRKEKVTCPACLKVMKTKGIVL